MLSMVAENLPELDRESLKNILRSLIDRITLDYSSLACLYLLQNQAKNWEISGVPRGIPW